MKDVFDENEVNAVLRDGFYGPAAKRAAGRGRRRPKKKPKPAHYETICISLYNEDLERLDRKVAELKKAGHRKMNRSALIRFALDHVDTSKLPRSY